MTWGCLVGKVIEGNAIGRGRLLWTLGHELLYTVSSA